MYWNVQEQEERDYQAGMASEAQNALDWNRMNMPPDDSQRIDEAVGAGKYVVVMSGPVYCPSTDALMGSRKVMDSVHNTREQAEERAYDLGDMEDVSVYILPTF